MIQDNFVAEKSGPLFCYGVQPLNSELHCLTSCLVMLEVIFCFCLGLLMLTAFWMVMGSDDSFFFGSHLDTSPTRYPNKHVS